MKMKTSELTGAMLDRAVATAMGYPNGMHQSMLGHEVGNWGKCTPKKWKPSTDWAQGGPIIEREKINLLAINGGDWAAQAGDDFFCSTSYNYTGDPEICFAEDDCILGPTPLIAAMRCYVASKLGDEIEVPDELV